MPASKDESLIGRRLVRVSVVEYKESRDGLLHYDKITMELEEGRKITLSPLAETDEVKVTITSAKASKSRKRSNPIWTADLISQPLEGIWYTRNHRGYADMVILGFGRWHPSLCVLAEGSTLLVLRVRKAERKRKSKKYRAQRKNR